MKKILMLALAGMTVLGGVGTATIEPAMAAGGCGPGWHRGPHGRCLRNYVHPRRHPCPRGYHLSRYGRCRPNY